jgi:hypothetical protein
MYASLLIETADVLHVLAVGGHNLNPLHMLALMLTMTCEVDYYYHPHSVDEETGTEKLGDLLSHTAPGGGRPWFQTQEVQFERLYP